MARTFKRMVGCAGMCWALACTGAVWALEDAQKDAQEDAQEEFLPASVNAPRAQDVERSWIEMYGVRLSRATRDVMRQALHAHGVKPVREDSRYWVDVYDAQGLIRGASQFFVGYTAATQKLAFAEYAFAPGMDSLHTQQIVSLVTAKYGPPAETAGQLAMGTYAARWRMSDGMHIQVVRERPETSTYLKFINQSVDLEMKAELDEEMSARQKTKLAGGELASPTVAAPSR